MRITNDRVIDARRKRIPLTESALDGEAHDSDALPGIAKVSDNQPTPEMGYAMGENLRNLVSRMDQRHPDLKHIAALRLVGHSAAEIARQMGTPLRTVERRLKWIEEIWDAYRREEA